MMAGEALELYKSRDASEKLFRVDVSRKNHDKIYSADHEVLLIHTV